MQDGKNAASLNVAQQYVSAFNQLAQKGNTLILPSNVNDVSQIVAQAMTIYQKVCQSSPDELQLNEKFFKDNSDNLEDLSENTVSIKSGKSET